MGTKGSRSEKVKIIVCDAGPVIHLHEAGILSLLRKIGEVFVPQRVQSEVSSTIHFEKDWPEWLQVISLSRNELKEAEMWTKIGDLHEGEAEAFVLARTLKVDWLLTDDSSARYFASNMGLEVHGSLGIVLWNVAHKYLSTKEGISALRSLRKTSLWLSKKIFLEAEKAIAEMGLRNNKPK
jgi:predicted nucleic acid-binding protein